ncbi:hypothetical protein THAOC_30509 [Thalassiosira oceanica]|uniref:Uncharacterized protein n=1 Tax=Thalassiosira oceanica TaxID=159749 RepID=K0RE10_THAOC|nr:hypothetical protein THAOC_30509 [Thalassiosira oceanica]|eukprot:EJK50499.1 hypothetical protein THAOC_30509 [Thalassiosira oceanica]
MDLEVSSQRAESRPSLELMRMLAAGWSKFFFHKDPAIQLLIFRIGRRRGHVTSSASTGLYGTVYWRYCGIRRRRCA